MTICLLGYLPAHSVSQAHLLLHVLLDLVDRDGGVRLLLDDLDDLLGVDDGLLILE